MPVKPMEPVLPRLPSELYQERAVVERFEEGKSPIAVRPPRVLAVLRLLKEHSGF